MQVSSSSQQFLSRKEVAVLLHVSAASVTRWARAHRLPYVQTLGGHRRYPADAVIHLAEDLDRRGTFPDDGEEQEEIAPW